MSDLAGKVAIVTGASKGVGALYAKALGDAGAQVACLARPSPELDAFPGAMAVPCDVSDPRSVDAAVAAVVERFGRLDILVNNAGSYVPQAIDELTDELVRRTLETNLLGPIWCSRAALPHLRKSGAADIVNVSSESVSMPFPMLSMYVASKGGLEAMSAAMQNELRGTGIRVTILRSGAVAGSAGSAMWPPEVGKKFMETMAKSGELSKIGVPATPESMATALVRIVSLPRDVTVDLVVVRAASLPGKQS
jgi:NAD(P)-dependent dehydrogenase (short-subunit alcohol dehydrogenase family)